MEQDRMTATPAVCRCKAMSEIRTSLQMLGRLRRVDPAALELYRNGEESVLGGIHEEKDIVTSLTFHRVSRKRPVCVCDDTVALHDPTSGGREAMRRALSLHCSGIQEFFTYLSTGNLSIWHPLSWGRRLEIGVTEGDGAQVASRRRGDGRGLAGATCHRDGYQRILCSPMKLPLVKSLLVYCGLAGCGLVRSASADLVGVWKFDGDATDSSGNGHDGVATDVRYSDDTPDVLGGQSLELEGGYIEVAHTETLTIREAITISVFVKPGNNEWEGILAKNPSDGSSENHAGNYELRIDSGGRNLHFLHQQGGNDDTAFHQSALAIVESDVWSHLAITAEVASGDVDFYINGEHIETLAGVISVDEFPPNENPLYIGSRADFFTGFDGLMDELSLWNEVLDADRIALLAEGPANLEGAPDADGDGIADFFEERFAFLDPDNAADGQRDRDGDGVSNAAEFVAGTNLESEDTDEDGLKDGVETNTGIFVGASDTGTDPRRADTDGDGLADGVESNSGRFIDADDPGTSPLATDTDGDTFGDFVEVTLASDPVDAASSPDGIVLAESEEAWDVAAAWTDGQAPRAGKNYLVVSSVAPVLESPRGSDPVFAGDRLNLIGAEARLRLLHSGTARVSELGMDGATLAKGRAGNSGLGLAGDKLTFTQPSAIELGEPGTLAIGSTLFGGSAITVRSTGDRVYATNAIVRLEAVNSDFSGQWQMENVTLKGAAVDSLGSGDLFLTNATLDLDYNLNHVAGRIDVSGEDSRIVLDQTLAFGQFTISNGEHAVPEGVYDFEGLGEVFDGGLQPIFIDGGGLLVVGGDSDDDALPDVWERDVFGNLDLAGDGDGDADGLDNAREFLFGTDPSDADSDADGLSDGEEIERGSSPRLADTDGDGLGDGVETKTGVYLSAEDTGTDPNKADTDADGLPDGLENDSGTFVAPEDPGTDPNNRDTDGDGATDGVEVTVGTNPHDASDASAIPGGTVGLWSFDAEAAVVADLSGNGNDASVEGATWVNDPERGGVMEISEDGHLEVEHSESLTITKAITIAAWVKPVGEIGWDGILAKNPSEGSLHNHAGNYELRIDNGGRQLHFLHQQGGSNDTAFHQAAQAIIPPDVWTHVTVTADTQSRDVSFYINGELSETLEDVIPVEEFPANANPLYIGSRADKFTPMNGFLDDVMLLNRAVSADEVAGLMAGGFSRTGGPGDPEPPADFAIVGVEVDAGGSIRVDFRSQPGQTYVGEFSTDLINWEVTVEEVASGGEMTIIRQPLPAAPTGFIRVRVKP